MSRYLIASEENLSYLAHHGIQGQKWGVRRFQNEDGTLTPEGRERYGLQKEAPAGRIKGSKGKRYRAAKKDAYEAAKKQIALIHEYYTKTGDARDAIPELELARSHQYYDYKERYGDDVVNKLIDKGLLKVQKPSNNVMVDTRHFKIEKQKK